MGIFNKVFDAICKDLYITNASFARDFSEDRNYSAHHTTISRWRKTDILPNYDSLPRIVFSLYHQLDKAGLRQKKGFQDLREHVLRIIPEDAAEMKEMLTRASEEDFIFNAIKLTYLWQCESFEEACQGDEQVNFMSKFNHQNDLKSIINSTCPSQADASAGPPIHTKLLWKPSLMMIIGSIFVFGLVLMIIFGSNPFTLAAKSMVLSPKKVFLYEQMPIEGQIVIPKGFYFEVKTNMHGNARMFKTADTLEDIIKFSLAVGKDRAKFLNKKIENFPTVLWNSPEKPLSKEFLSLKEYPENNTLDHLEKPVFLFSSEHIILFEYWMD